MKTKILLLLFFISHIVTAQNFQTVEQVNDACATLGFSANEDAEIAVDNILDKIGVFRNFTIQECPNINNAVAKNIETKSGNKERYILYDSEFFKKIDDKASNDWAAVSILAHEIAHHLNGHALNDEGSNHRFELEADYSCGYYLGRMGATLEEAQSAIQTLRYEKATSTHPAKKDRLDAIEKGWSKATGKTTVKTIEESNAEKAIELFRNGEEAYQKYNYTVAADYFEQAIELGNVDAYYYLSNSYYLGFGKELDYKKAYNLAKEGYEQGSIPATYQLGKYLANGFGVVKNSEDAERLFQKNYQIKWFKEQFKKSNIPFHAYTIGYMYHKGFGGVDKDEDLAFYWYKKASDLGDPTAKNNLGVMYQNGNVVSQDYKKAMDYFLEASEVGSNNAQYGIGRLYYNGFGVEKDYKKSYEWYMKAAEDGFVSAQNIIAEHHLLGRGVLKNLEKAIFWFSKTAEQNSSRGQFGLGYIYTMQKKYSEALKWYLLSAEQGSASAQYNIGIFYEFGRGVELNKTTAKSWYQKAANQGHEKAKSKL